MAYLGPVEVPCQAGHCERPAIHILYTKVKQPVAYLCPQHSAAYLAQLENVERESEEAGS